VVLLLPGINSAETTVSPSRYDSFGKAPAPPWMGFCGPGRNTMANAILFDPEQRQDFEHNVKAAGGDRRRSTPWSSRPPRRPHKRHHVLTGQYIQTSDLRSRRDGGLFAAAVGRTIFTAGPLAAGGHAVLCGHPRRFWKRAHRGLAATSSRSARSLRWPPGLFILPLSPLRAR